MENMWIKKKTILIVDDEEQLLIMLKEIFERAGYINIITANSGEEAHKLILAKKKLNKDRTLQKNNNLYLTNCFKKVIQQKMTIPLNMG